MATAAAKTTGKFADLNTKLVYTPKTAEGKGFLPPLMRALTHITYALGLSDDDLPKTKAEKNYDAIEKMIKEEIDEAIKHFDKVEIPDSTDIFSSIATDQVKTYHKALKALSAEFSDWDKDTKVNNLTSLVHKLMGICAMLDRELVGLRDSDPGSNL